MTSQGLRTHHCGELRASHVGQTVRLSGWVASQRELGSALVFVDLRDRYGITQVSFDDTVPAALRNAARELTPETVVHVEGTVRPRPSGQANRERTTGEIEVLARSLEVLGPAKTPPFELDKERVGDELRLTYRYVDLRRPAPLAALTLRHHVLLAIRKRMDELGFLEVETPVLTKATPEGARDYLVPSRVQPGKFYALPQSPQIFKQLLMVAGLDKYFQIVKCFRDEDLRADRQPEFTQLDLELSFADEEMVQGIVSDVVAHAVGEVAPQRRPALPFPRLTWAEALRRYGSDKPDTRFGVELADASTLLEHTGFAVFRRALEARGRVRVLAAPGGVAFSRKDISALEELAATHGAKGLAWARVVEGEPGALDGGMTKFLSPAERRGLVQATGARPGDLLLAVADTFARSAAALAAVRLEVGRRCGLVERERLDFLWVVEFPMFERDEETGQLSPAHHPFCRPLEQSPGALENDPDAVRARSYDLVLNGVELGSGSVRIHDSETQQRIFAAIGLSPAEIETRFGFVLEAFRYGAPPHAGFAVGLDRFVMLLVGAETIRDVIAFPKTATAACLMTGAPTEVPERQLSEAGIALRNAAGRGAGPGGPPGL